MNEFSFFARGKLLLTSEYFVLDGVKALALPTMPGQVLDVAVQDEAVECPKLYWKSYDADESLWIDAVFDLKTLDVLESYAEPCGVLHSILKEARCFKPDFLNVENDIHASSYLEFSRHWGLGSSSTLIRMIASWAGACPYALLAKTVGGSGYDLACADADGPIFYRRETKRASIENANFNPLFKDQLYFVYLNQKQSSQKSVLDYKTRSKPDHELCQSLEALVDKIAESKDLVEFEECLKRHENIVAQILGQSVVKDRLFPDYWGAVKSLGAWGGDFALATSDRGDEKTFDYFTKQGYETVFKYDDLILDRGSK